MPDTWDDVALTHAALWMGKGYDDLTLREIERMCDEAAFGPGKMNRVTPTHVVAALRRMATWEDYEKFGPRPAKLVSVAQDIAVEMLPKLPPAREPEGRADPDYRRQSMKLTSPENRKLFMQLERALAQEQDPEKRREIRSKFLRGYHGSGPLAGTLTTSLTPPKPKADPTCEADLTPSQIEGIEFLIEKGHPIPDRYRAVADIIRERLAKTA